MPPAVSDSRTRRLVAASNFAAYFAFGARVTSALLPAASFSVATALSGVGLIDLACRLCPSHPLRLRGDDLERELAAGGFRALRAAHLHLQLARGGLAGAGGGGGPRGSGDGGGTAGACSS